MIRRKDRTIALLAVLSSASLLGCPLPADSGGDAGDDAGGAVDAALSDAPVDASADGATSDAEADGNQDGSSDSTIDGTIDAGADATDASANVEQPPPDADACGSGWRTLSKECDDGLGSNASTRRSCSAQCQVLDVLADAPTVVDGGPASMGRTLGGGRHPVGVTDDDGFAVAFVETQPTVKLSLSAFNRKGTALDPATVFSLGSNPAFDANPVVAGFPGARYVVAYNEFGGDGDELGIALRIVTPGTAPVGAPTFANRGRQFSQYDPDAILVGSQLVVAWIDDSDSATAPDIRFQTFDANLTPQLPGGGGVSDPTLAATSSAETDVALAPFAGSWAAAWRDLSGGVETVRIVAGNTSWSVGAFQPGPTGDKPALAELDATHLLVVFSVGADVDDSGTANGSKIQAAILDTSAPGAVTPFDVTSAASEPNAMRVGARLFVTWRTERLAPDVDGYGQELWLTEVTWNGTALDASASQMTLPRWNAHRAGDQRHAALAASALPVEGALVGAWEDWGRAFGPLEAVNDVALELIPAPVLRAQGGDGGP